MGIGTGGRALLAREGALRGLEGLVLEHGALHEGRARGHCGIAAIWPRDKTLRCILARRSILGWCRALPLRRILGWPKARPEPWEEASGAKGRMGRKGAVLLVEHGVGACTKTWHKAGAKAGTNSGNRRAIGHSIGRTALGLAVWPVGGGWAVGRGSILACWGCRRSPSPGVLLALGLSRSCACG